MAAMDSVTFKNILVLLSCALVCVVGGDDMRCNHVATSYYDLGLNRKDVPAIAVQGEHLQICPQGYTCCTRQMEDNLAKKSEEVFNKAMADTLSVIRTSFISRAAKFDEFFSQLIDNSYRDLHSMFTTTYGLLYQQDSEVFKNLFTDLKAYYHGTDHNLSDLLDRFFETLLQKVFVLMNQQYKVDSKYLMCVTEHMDQLAPFGDVPAKLTIQIRRAFLAARTFVQGLKVGRNVILDTARLLPSGSCKKAVTKMLHCPYCRGMPSVKPCNDYCVNVMKGCLAHYAELDRSWNKYIDAMYKVAERLEGPFNIEAVVDPLDVKISEAIMNLQENSADINDKVASGCGELELDNSRKKRDTTEDAIITDKEKRGTRNKNFMRNKDAHVRPTTAAGTNLDTLVRGIKKKIEDAKKFFSNMPYAICNDEMLAAPPSNKDECWNGMEQARYQPEIVLDGLVNQNNNPEVDVDVTRPHSIIQQQILQLKTVEQKLKAAANGIEVDYMDIDDEIGASGSGSHGGSGSGGGYTYGSGDGGKDEIYVVVSPTTPPRKTLPPIKRPNSATYMSVTVLTIILPIFTVLLNRQWWNRKIKQIAKVEDGIIHRREWLSSQGGDTRP
ncbi:unnamed protein product [Owenia fusiformis]|uniref:Glypican-6 n=1 Tax=Owenia fusiformis TaxID=6347 RepID=A0A8S4NJA9_OWEFU|nr:unnamed protein product [Owenia fusiformis]